MMVVVMMTALVVESPEGPFDPATRFPACSSPLNNQYSAGALILYTSHTFLCYSYNQYSAGVLILYTDNTFCVSQCSALYTSNTFCGKVPINTLSYCTLLILFGPANTLYCTLLIIFLWYHRNQYSAIVPIQYSAKDQSRLVCSIYTCLCFCTHEYTSDCFALFSNSALFLLFVVTFQPSLSPVSLSPDNYMNSK